VLRGGAGTKESVAVAVVLVATIITTKNAAAKRVNRCSVRCVGITFKA
jgi:hypothetical protein